MPHLSRVIGLLLGVGFLTSAAPLSVTWDSTHPVLVHEGGHYGRITRLDRDTLIAGFDFKGAIHFRLSHDEGKTWEVPGKIAAIERGTCTNTEFCVLKNGNLLCFFNFRPSGGANLPYSIRMCRSRDGAKSWSPPKTLYSAGNDFGDGCWEPAAVQLPDGQVHIYFANESPYRKSNEQEISLLRSKDDGRTWSIAETVSFRKHSRDGMPVPVLAANGSAIAVAIEDNGLSGGFKPVIVCSRLERGGWRGGVVDGDNHFRWGALAKPLPASTYAGAPYLRQFPDGPFILSFQMADSGDMKDSRMAVSLGNNRAREFGVPTFPFPETPGKAQLWNSLFIKNENTVTAVSETTLNGTFGIWSVDGRFAH